MTTPASASRRLNWKDAASLIVGIMLGTGIFTVFPTLAAGRAPAAGLLMGVWVIGTLVALCGAFCYAELTALFPHRGGDYVFLREAFGRKGKNPVSFLFAWTQVFVIRPASLVSLSIIFAVNARILLRPFVPETAGPAIQTAMVYGAPVFFTLAALAGLRGSVLLQNILTGLKVMALGLFICAGLWLGRGLGENLAPLFVPEGASAGTLLKNVGMALIPIMWVFGGWNEAPYLAADTRNPAKDIPKALVVGLLGLGGLYVLVNFVYVLHLSPAGLAASWTSASDLMGRWFGSRGEMMMAAILALSAAGAVNGLVLTGGRLADAFAEDLSIPRPREEGVPRGALLFNLAVTAGVALLMGARPESIDRLLLFTSGAVWVFFALAAGAVFVFRRRVAPEKYPYRMPGYPAVPLVFLVMCGYMLYGAWSYKPAETLWGLGLLAAGIPAYLIAQKLLGPRLGTKMDKLVQSAK